MGKPLVLAVDQDSDQLSSIKNCLKKENFKVYTATSSTEAIKVLKKYRASILISDEDIPEYGGLYFLKQVKSRYPETVRCLISSNPRSELIAESRKKKDICSSLKKPWKPPDLLATIRDCVEKFHTAEANRQSMKVILSAFQESDRPREEDLALSSAILNILPQAAVVLNEDLDIILSNDIYNLKVAMELGTAQTVFPDHLKSSLLNKLKDGWREFRMHQQIGDNRYILRIRPLRETDSKTAILFFDTPGF